MFSKRYIPICFLALFVISSVKTFAHPIKPDSAKWVDSVMLSLNIQEKIGQMLNIRVMSGKDEKYYSNIDRIKKSGKKLKPEKLLFLPPSSI